MAVYTFQVNGTAQNVTVDDPKTDLLYVLQDYLWLTGPKFGCGLAQCGSCTVLLDGKPIRSCVTPVSAAAGGEIISIEGLGTPQHPHPIQQAFISQQAMQCGYCISGPMLYGKVFVDANPGATSDQILEAVGKTKLLCRCNAYPRMLAALALYAQGKTQ